MHLPDRPFPIVGLTGGIASGKSTVGRGLKKGGWVVLDADQAAREVVAPGTEGLAALVQGFGASILGPDGALDRARMAQRVFEDPQARRQLEQLLHPRIEAHLAAQVAALPDATHGVVLEGSLWIERGQAPAFDALWLVSAPEALRLQRLQERDGLSETAARARLASQSSDAEKRLHADAEIRADGRDLALQVAWAEARCRASWRQRRERRRLHSPCPFSFEQLHTLLELLLSKGGAFADIFVERRQTTRLALEDGRMEDLLASDTFGVSLRLVEAETTRFADLIAPSLEELEAAARQLAAPGTGTAQILPSLEREAIPSPTLLQVDPSSVSLEEKVALVRHVETLARAESERLRAGVLRQVSVGYGDTLQQVWIASALRQQDGWRTPFVSDLRPQGVLSVRVVAGEADRLQTGYDVLGEARGFELFTQEAVAHTAHEAVRLAFQALDAHPAPSGTFPVLLSAEAGGTMIHEACGHGLEADLARAGMSAFSDKLGEQVAAEGVTLVDDGTLPHQRGSSAVDDEGVPAQRVVLIERGILRSYLHSRKTALQMHVEPTGNGRRESYRNLPIPRMRNTFLAPGPEDPEAMLRDLDRGLWVTRMGGGQVDTVSGNFVFQVTEGFWVEQGVVQHPIRNATLAGSGPEVLRQLQRIGHNLAPFAIGTCGKDGQGVPVSHALPTILCPALVVGGTEPIA